MSVKLQAFDKRTTDYDYRLQLLKELAQSIDRKNRKLLLKSQINQGHILVPECEMTDGISASAT
jgi:hypothetical protein